MTQTDSNSDFLSIAIWSLVLVVITPIFLIPTLLLYKRRNEYPINCRSPIIACVGCLALYFDSLLNVVIQILRSKELRNRESDYELDKAICAIGVLDTMSFHYIALFAFYLRSFRIQKVMNCYKRYVKIIEQRNNQITEAEGGGQTIGEQQQIAESALFKEKNLLKLLGIIGFTLTGFGIASLFFQIFFMFIPVFESDQCINWFNCKYGSFCIIEDECGVAKV